MFKWLEKKLDKYNQVVTEGNYRLPPMTWGRLLRGLKPELQLPATSEVAVGTSMIDTGKMLGEKFVWATIITAATLTTLKWAALGFAIIGSAVYTMEYIRAKKSREDVITEVNFAGQLVKGTRADLCRLQRAQLRIMNVSNNVDASSSVTAEEAVSNILRSVEEERKRVHVSDGGRYGADKKSYAFTEPGFRLVIDESKLPQHCEKEKAAKTSPASLREAWQGKRMTPDDVIETLAVMQESLPQDMAEKLQQRLQKKPAAPSA